MNPYLEGIRLVQEVTTGAFSFACVAIFGFFTWHVWAQQKLPLLSPMSVCAILALGGAVALSVGLFTGQSNAFDHVETATENIGIALMGLAVCIGWIYMPPESS